MYIYDEDYDILGVDDVDDKEEDLIDDKDVVNYNPSKKTALSALAIRKNISLGIIHFIKSQKSKSKIARGSNDKQYKLHSEEHGYEEALETHA
ncbi:12582_t:CDS:2 [Entrophospora sp. SA101]|nr:5262_t:CDS:2 [Entrophospora sp. SA101]CAJ0633070.1 12582_t:CDS:2 [Entrophospora sp. SA101]CAJ0831217.1 12823_t:CDS:2 [Entrophospora sp. SA101]CAJ0926261.1 18303_t:CDS:2 [Entrophospora sp. SA101]